MQSFSVSSATTTASSQPATTANSGQPSQFTAQINLEAPSSVLPPSITPLSASSINAPSSLTIVTPNAGDVSSIVAPGNSSIPSVGTTPSSGPSAITPPGNTSILPPGGSSGAIVPPGGVGSSGGRVKPLGYGQDASGKCFNYGLINYGHWEDCKDAEQIQDFQKKQALEVQLASDPGNLRIKAQLEFIDTRIMAGDACARNTTGDKSAARSECRTNISLIQQSDFYADLSPAQRLHFWQITQGGLESGYIGRDEIQQMKRVLERCRVSGGQMTCNSPQFLAGGGRPRAQFTQVIELVVLTGLGIMALFALASQSHSVVIDSKPFALPPLPQIRLEIPWLSGIPIPGGSGAVLPWNAVNPVMRGIIGSGAINRSSSNDPPAIPTNPTDSPGADWQWRGKPGSVPGSPDGSWYNPNTGESLRPDLNHPAPVGPHWDWKDADGNWWRVFPNGQVLPK